MEIDTICTKLLAGYTLKLQIKDDVREYSIDGYDNYYFIESRNNGILFELAGRRTNKMDYASMVYGYRATAGGWPAGRTKEDVVKVVRALLSELVAKGCTIKCITGGLSW